MKKKIRAFFVISGLLSVVEGSHAKVDLRCWDLKGSAPREIRVEAWHKEQVKVLAAPGVGGGFWSGGDNSVLSLRHFSANMKDYGFTQVNRNTNADKVFKTEWKELSEAMFKALFANQRIVLVGHSSGVNDIQKALKEGCEFVKWVQARCQNGIIHSSTIRQYPHILSKGWGFPKDADGKFNKYCSIDLKKVAQNVLMIDPSTVINGKAFSWDVCDEVDASTLVIQGEMPGLGGKVPFTGEDLKVIDQKGIEHSPVEQTGYDLTEKVKFRYVRAKKECGQGALRGHLEISNLFDNSRCYEDPNWFIKRVFAEACEVAGGNAVRADTLGTGTIGQPPASH